MATVWKGASMPEPCSLSPMENGWVLVDGSYKMKWFEGDTVPQDVWRILDADTDVLEEQVETDFNDPVTDELLYTTSILSTEAIILMIIATFHIQIHRLKILHQDCIL